MDSDNRGRLSFLHDDVLQDYEQFWILRTNVDWVMFRKLFEEAQAAVFRRSCLPAFLVLPHPVIR